MKVGARTIPALMVMTGSLAGCPVYQWPDDSVRIRPGTTIEDPWGGAPPPAGAGADDTTPRRAAPASAGVAGSAGLENDPYGGAPTVSLAGDDGLFRNTYYDFPREGAGSRDATIFDASCSPVAKVTQAFHDQVCVQGSGRLASGETVSFAKRDCSCAAVCPRTGQKICFERLDASRFPSGRGATGGPITPLLTIAVDPSVIPLGTPVFIPEFVGVPRTDGSPHDGCFIAQDRGLRVVGKHIDVFTGDPSMTQALNARVPSNKGVHVRPGDARCSRR